MSGEPTGLAETKEPEHGSSVLQERRRSSSELLEVARRARSARGGRLDVLWTALGALIRVLGRATARRPKTAQGAQLRELLAVTQAQLRSVEPTLENASDAALADFYVATAETLLRRSPRVLPSRSADTSALPIDGFFHALSRRIEQSGYEANLDDMRDALDMAGWQLHALLLTGRDWPVLVTEEDVAPIIVKPQAVYMPYTMVLDMLEDAVRLKAEGCDVQFREPFEAMKVILAGLASWLPWRTTAKPASPNVPDGGNGGNGGSSGSRASGGSKDGGSRKPNVKIFTNHPDCRVTYRWPFLGYELAFGGPQTPVERYLDRGYYYFKAYVADDSSSYETKQKNKMPECSPLTINFPPRPH